MRTLVHCFRPGGTRLVLAETLHPASGLVRLVGPVAKALPPDVAAEVLAGRLGVRDAGADEPEPAGIDLRS